MTKDQILKILKDYKAGSISDEAALESLKTLPFEDLGFANVDHHRSLRQGFPEVIFGAGKSPDQVAGIVGAMRKNHHNILITRATPEQYELVKGLLPDAEFHVNARAIVVRRENVIHGKGTVMVIS